MAEQYDVKAVLDANIEGFKRGMQEAQQQSQSLGNKLKSGLGMGTFMAIGQKALDAVTSGFTGMLGEMSSSQAAWKTFQGNMKSFGVGAGEIRKVQSSLQDFAQKTIYSSSDMAQTYAQLKAVGTKSCLDLVKGFGGLASAAENPQQAMKTLSQQATQMAAKPTVQWMDFKLMLEQTPAGIAAVAKQMGMSTSELVSAVQAGKVKTEDFFKAIEKAGNSKAMQKQAMQYKTVGQAMDGLKETLGNTLLPVFNAVTGIMTDDMSKLADSTGKAGSTMEQAGKWITKHQDGIRNAAKAVGLLAAAFMGMKVVNSVAGTVTTFAGGIQKLASPNLLGKLIPNLGATAAGETAVGTASATAGKQVLQSAAAFALMGAGVAAIAAGFYLLAAAAVMIAQAGAPAVAVFGMMVGAMVLLIAAVSKMTPISQAGAAGLLALGAAVVLCGAGFYLMASAATMVANAGTAAIAVFAGMVVGIAALLVVAAAVGPVLTVGAVGLLAFGAAMLMVGAGALLAGAGIKIVAAALPAIATYGLTAAAAITVITGAMLIMTGASITAAAGLVALGGGSLAASAGMLVFGAAMLVGAAGTALMAVSLKAVNSSMKSIAGNAKRAESSLQAMRGSVNVVEDGVSALGSKVKSAMSTLISSFSRTASKATSTGKQLGNSFATGMKPGLARATTQMRTTVSKMMSAARSHHGSFVSTGRYLGNGLASGVRSATSSATSSVDRLIEKINEAARKKAKIHSPSKVWAYYGRMLGAGLVRGMDKSSPAVMRSARALMTTPASSGLALAGGLGLYDDYNYGGGQYRFESVVNLDGREIARGTAAYTEEELNKRTSRNNRKKGLR